MATIANQNQDQDLANPGNPVNQPGATSGTSGGVGTSQGGATNGGAAGPNQTPVSPVAASSNGGNASGYTDVGTYLNANQNNQAANNLGSQVAGNLTSSYNTTMGDINNSANSQTSSINSGYTPENTQLIQQAEANPTSFAYNTPTAAPQDTTGFLNAGNSLAFASAPTLNQGNITAYQNQLNDTYTGPTTWADVTNANGTTTPGYGSLQGEVNTAQQNANINTPGMANVLTQQVEQQLNPGQTGQGINNLDTLLLTGNANNVNQVNTAAQPFAGLTNYLNTQNTNLGTDVTNAEANAAAASTAAQNAFTGTNGALTNLNADITNTTNQDLTQAQQGQTQLAQDLQNLETAGSTVPGQGITNYNVGQLSAADQAALGLTAQQTQTLEQALQNAGTSQYESAPNFGYWSPTSNINLDQFLQQQNPTTGITAGTVATPQQYQEMNAINQLFGSQAPLQTEVINPAMSSEAGTYNPQNYNQFNYQAALQAAQNAATTDQQQAQQQANAASAAALAQHNASKGGFLNKVENVAQVVNPVTYLANKGVANVGENIAAQVAYGGDINSYLDKEGK